MSDEHTRDVVYGPVDVEVLEELRSSFDTRRVLDAVDGVDQIRYRICEPEGLRTELLKLHGMAHTLINGAEMTVPSSDEPIWELAESLSFELSEFLEYLEKAVDCLDVLARLAPADDWIDAEDTNKPS